MPSRPPNTPDWVWPGQIVTLREGGPSDFYCIRGMEWTDTAIQFRIEPVEQRLGALPVPIFIYTIEELQQRVVPVMPFSDAAQAVQAVHQAIRGTLAFNSATMGMDEIRINTGDGVSILVTTDMRIGPSWDSVRPTPRPPRTSWERLDTKDDES